MNLASSSPSLTTLSTLAARCDSRLRNIIDSSKYARLVSNEILALSNEVYDLHIVLDDIEANHGVMSEYVDVRTAHVLRRTQSILARLDIVVTSSIQLDHNNEPAFRRSAWLWQRTSCKAMSQELRDIKQNIILLLASKAA